MFMDMKHVHITGADRREPPHRGQQQCGAARLEPLANEPGHVDLSVATGSLQLAVHVGAALTSRRRVHIARAARAEDDL